MLGPAADIRSGSSQLLPALFVVLWSTGFIGARLGLPHAEPLTFLSVRYALVILLMGAVVVATGERWPRSWRQVGHIAVTGLLLHAVYLGGVFVSIHRGLPAGLAALVVGLQPLLTAVFAGWLLGSTVSARQWIGLALGLVGVIMVVGSKLGAAELAPAQLGTALVPAVAALFGITAGTLYQKAFCPRFELATGAVIQFVPTLLVTALAAGLTESMDIDWTGEFTFALAWLVLVLSVGAISLLNLLIRRGTAVDVASLFYLVPPTTAVIAWAVFGETLSALAIVGMVVAVTGVWLARRA
jgi:drug/metabolite transporter (DMT)-like permease